MCLMTACSNQWPHGDIQPYLPEFSDGWQPPPLPAAPEPRKPVSRVEALQPASSGVSQHRWSHLGTEGKEPILILLFLLLLLLAEISHVETVAAPAPARTRV